MSSDDANHTARRLRQPVRLGELLHFLHAWAIRNETQFEHHYFFEGIERTDTGS